jgi:hypothetical protein
MDEGADKPDINLLEIWRCPQLGGPVTFGYCRLVNEGLPCGRVVACWGGTFDVAAFLAEHYSREQIEQVFGASTDRLTRIIDAVKKAKES